MNVRLAVKSRRLFVCILVAVACLPAMESKPDEPDKTAPPAADSMIGNEAGQVRDDNGLKMKLVWCPPGQFTMGSPKSEAHRSNSEDQVEVTLTKGIWLGKYEVTQSEWKQAMMFEPWKGKDRTKEGDRFPATCVTCGDSKNFCRTLTEGERKAGRLPEGWEYTLPTEAQWERACRAGTETIFSFGNDELNLGEYAWFFDNTSKADDVYAHRVGQKKANPWGLFDMHGNVFEWCRDWYGDELPGGSDPEVTETRTLRVVRGGGCNVSTGFCRSAYRGAYYPLDRQSNVGLRVALSPLRNR